MALQVGPGSATTALLVRLVPFISQTAMLAIGFLKKDVGMTVAIEIRLFRWRSKSVRGRRRQPLPVRLVPFICQIATLPSCLLKKNVGGVSASIEAAAVAGGAVLATPNPMTLNASISKAVKVVAALVNGTLKGSSAGRSENRV